MQITEIEKARQLFKTLEMITKKSGVENAIRIICIQEILKDLKKRSY